MAAVYRVIRKLLDGLYFACGAIAALFLIAILALIVLQMVARWTAEVFPGAPDYAGYCMAAASFFAFSHALNRGAHIRVNILLNVASGVAYRILETWCFAIGTALSWYLAYFAVRNTRFSHMINDISQGQDATPLWIPQTGMAVGAVVFAICMTDHFLHVLVTGKHRISAETVSPDTGE